MEVVVYGPLRGVTGQKAVTVPFDGGSIADAIDAFVSMNPRAHNHLFTDDDALRPSVRVQRDGETVSPTDSCPADATIKLFPAVQSGNRGAYRPY